MRHVPRSLGPALPEHLQQLLSGQQLRDRIGDTFLLLTIDDDGWPHMAMLSVGEVLRVDPRTLRVALWLQSTATHNLERTARGVLACVAYGAGYYVRLTAERESDLDLGVDGRLACFKLTVEDVLEDAVDYARLTSGVRFELPDPDRVVAHWQATHAALSRR
jgi:hypothetical protein